MQLVVYCFYTSGVAHRPLSEAPTRNKKGDHETLLYELRIYDVVPGRLGALHQRFANTTCRIFERLGIKQLGFWEDVVGTSNRLTYILVWEDMAHRDRVWTQFQSDPEWIAARAKSEEDGPIVAKVTSTLMKATPYSTLK